MLLQVVFAGLAILCGVTVNRVVIQNRLPLSIAPFSGLAIMAVLTRWCVVTGAPPLVSSAVVLSLALVGLGLTVASASDWVARVRVYRVPAVLLLLAALIPAAILGVVFAGVETPVSTHDGAFHVETIDSLRRGAGLQGWYPVGFHTTAAAVLGLLPWLDSARGTAEIGQGLILLAPIAVFSLGLALGLSPLQASVAAIVQALTVVFPYDNHLWGGWPLGMSLLLLLGLWAVAARWIKRPTRSLAAIGGLLAGAIVLTHGTEVYSAIIGLAVIVALKWRQIQLGALLRQLPVALVLAAVCVLPYLATLLHWAAAGAASSAGSAALDSGAPQMERGAGVEWLEFVLSVTGAAGLIDLPLRVVLLALGARMRQLRLVLGGWATFTALLFAVTFVDVAPVNWLFVVTFPWLVHHRPPQLVVVFASLLVGAGLIHAVDLLRSLRPRLVTHRHAWRRLAIVSGILVAFFAEGSIVSVYKTLDQVIAERNVFSADDRAAMSWLRQNARPGELVVNDLAVDAGIWAPYKAPVAILLPRSAPGPLYAEREPILTHVLDLSASPSLRASACALGVGYVYYGGRTLPDVERQVPERAVLEHASDLEEVFSSGQAAIFRVRLRCTQS